MPAEVVVASPPPLPCISAAYDITNPQAEIALFTLCTRLRTAHALASRVVGLQLHRGGSAGAQLLRHRQKMDDNWETAEANNEASAMDRSGAASRRSLTPGGDPRRFSSSAAGPRCAPRAQGGGGRGVHL